MSSASNSRAVNTRDANTRRGRGGKSGAKNASKSLLRSLPPNVTSCSEPEGKKGSRLFIKGYDENGKIVFERVWSKEFEEMCISLPKMKPPTPLKQATIEAFFTARVGERGEGLEDKPSGSGNPTTSGSDNPTTSGSDSVEFGDDVIDVDNE